MQAVLDRIAARKAEIDRHPLYTWMAGDEVPLQDRFVFAPLFAGFILGFSDMNRWHMRYPDPATPYEEAINRHTEEDETHSALFLEDWAELGFDDQLGWGVVDTMTWYYSSPETEVFRRYAMRIVQMCVQNPDPLVRFAVMESIEACGHVFFGHTAPLAEELSRRTGAALRYFGPYHLAKETGALIDAEDLFENAHLTDAQRGLACALVDEVFDMFAVKNDHLLAYARQLTAGAPPPRPAALRARSVDATPVPADVAPLHAVQGPSTTAPAVDQPAIAARLTERRYQLRGHPFLAWLASEHDDPAAVLRRYVPLWIPDIMGYADLMTYALTYAQPRSAPERALNRHARLLASHHELFVADAAALELDAHLRWSAGRTLEFLGRGDSTDLQRRSMATFLAIAFGHDSPVVRYWLLEALQASGEAFFHHTAALARATEQRNGVALHYLADRHRLSHPPLAPDPDADAVEFARLPVTAGERRAALTAIDAVFDALGAQFDQSLLRAGEQLHGPPAGRASVAAGIVRR